MPPGRHRAATGCYPAAVMRTTPVLPSDTESASDMSRSPSSSSRRRDARNPTWSVGPLPRTRREPRLKRGKLSSIKGTFRSSSWRRVRRSSRRCGDLAQVRSVARFYRLMVYHGLRNADWAGLFTCRVVVERFVARSQVEQAIGTFQAAEHPAHFFVAKRRSSTLQSKLHWPDHGR
jgi:hypothetical protein